jgi:hypothetical protein
VKFLVVFEVLRDLSGLLETIDLLVDVLERIGIHRPVKGAVKRRLGTKVQDLSVIPPATEGGKYSIASMGMSQTQAQQTCDSVKAAHQSCEVVSGSTAS